MKYQKGQQEQVHEVTLFELLDSREHRAEYQRMLLSKYALQGGVLVSVTLNIPGTVKDRSVYRSMLADGMENLAAAAADLPAEILHREMRMLVTGPEGYLIVQPAKEISAAEVKKMTVNLEETLPLGRLYDMDVICADGGISRTEIGADKRTCILCGDDAKVCARSRRHSTDALLHKINEMIREYGI